MKKTGLKPKRLPICKQITFFENCKKKISTAILHLINISRWSDKGVIVEANYKNISFAKEKHIGLMNTCMKEYYSKVREINEGHDYSRETESNDVPFIKGFVKTLSLPLKLETIKKPYPEIQLVL